MVQTLAGGVFGLLVAWLGIGGWNRRARIAIREELEIVRLLPVGEPARGRLERRALDRLEIYMERKALRGFLWQGVGLSILVACVLTVGAAHLRIEPGTFAGDVALGVGIGAVASVLIIAARVAYIFARPDTRHEFIAAVRGGTNRR